MAKCQWPGGRVCRSSLYFPWNFSVHLTSFSKQNKIVCENTCWPTLRVALGHWCKIKAQARILEKLSAHCFTYVFMHRNHLNQNPCSPIKPKESESLRGDVRKSAFSKCSPRRSAFTSKSEKRSLIKLWCFAITVGFSDPWTVQGMDARGCTCIRKSQPLILWCSSASW